MTDGGHSNPVCFFRMNDLLVDDVVDFMVQSYFYIIKYSINKTTHLFFCSRFVSYLRSPFLKKITLTIWSS